MFRIRNVSERFGSVLDLVILMVFSGFWILLFALFRLSASDYTVRFNVQISTSVTSFFDVLVVESLDPPGTSFLRDAVNGGAYSGKTGLSV